MATPEVRETPSQDTMAGSEIALRGLVLLGCGKMGSALLAGWLARGLPPASVWIVDPAPSDWVSAQGVHVNAALSEDPAVVVVAVKPQMITAAVPRIAAMGGGSTLFVSVAAGTLLSRLEETLGPGTPVVRAMPNTPAAIGQGISALVGNAAAGTRGLDLAETLMGAVGDVVRLDTEDQMNAVTGVSGSGPAYVFHMIETLAAAGVAEGLPEAVAMQLAQATVAGAGALAMAAADTPETLRINVTSPKGTTEAGLKILMDTDNGLPPLMARTVAAAAARSKALADG